MTEVPVPDFRGLFEAAPGSYLVLLPDLRVVAATNAYLSATMTTREGILGRYIFDVFPDDPDETDATGVRNLAASLDRVLNTCQPDAMAVQKYAVRRPQSEGGEFEERYWSPLNSPVLDAKGHVAYIIHRVEDVTEFIRLKRAGHERERVTQALQSRTEQMEAEFYQRAQQVAEANRQLARIYHQIELLMDRADDELSGGWEERHEAIAPEDMLARVGQLIVDHKRLEGQLRQSQKMEAVGQLAGGVAHDFNNLLTVITGYAALLTANPAMREVLPDLREIELAANRAGRLTQKLLAFSRKQVLQPRTINLNTVVTGMEELLRRLIAEHIQMVTILSSGLGNVRADPNQIEQVILNLALNARDAMPEGGRLIIETRNVRLDQPVDSLAPGSYVTLSISDTGHGMDARTRSRIFEPFFTTKEPGKGTGLGLAMVYGIVEQSGGAITVDSSPGSGAIFRVYLPLDEAPEERTQTRPLRATQTARHGSVLLVEDEAPLRRLISAILSAAGYRVIEAAGGDEALALATCKPIELLLTDVVMPNMSGPELVSRLRGSRPDLAVLYMSGYDRELVGQKALEGNADILPKPFTPRDLLTRINELLGAHRKIASSLGKSAAS
jgi:signal transduction histidine kinase/ActR/RegA family two-component response regulator